MKLYLLGLLFCFSTFLQAQNLDSLFNKFVGNSVKSHSLLSADNNEHKKCGLPLLMQIKANFDKFSKLQQSVIAARMTPTPMQTSIVSPSGFFRIHYDESGFNKPEYDVDELAVALDSAYNFEVNILGYPVPPTSASIFGEDKYDVFIKSLGFSDYGVTHPYNSLGHNKWNSYIEINSNFSDTYTKGLDAAKVTVAHELHHAIQMGCYRWKDTDNHFYNEITSTSMEDFVYDDINDYIFYLPNYFNNPSKTITRKITNHDGYDLVIWNLFLTQRYPDVGQKIIKYSWELMSWPNNQHAVKAMANAVEEYTSDSFKNVFNEFGVWTFFTSNRAKGNEYFKDALQYPLIRVLTKDHFDINSTSKVLAERTVSSQLASNNFMLFYDGITNNDTIYSIITNGDFIKASEYPNDYEDFTFLLLSNKSVGSDEIVKDEYYGKIESENLNNFSTSYIYNGIPVNDSSIIKNEIDYSYPQPFKLAQHDEVRIPVEVNGFGKADLYIYSSSMDLVFSSNVDIKNIEHPFVLWNGKDKSGKNVTTGVYIYVTNSDDKIKKGKLVVINK